MPLRPPAVPTAPWAPRRLANFQAPRAAEPLLRDWLQPSRDTLFRWTMGMATSADGRRAIAETAVAIQRQRGPDEFGVWLFAAALQAALHQDGGVPEASLTGLPPLELRMKVIVMGAGIVGVSTAWYLLDEGHEVTVIDRQPDAALETSFANGGQISVSFCEPWANADAPFKVAKWLLRDDAPLLFRPRLDPHQWRWGLSFLGQCNTAAFERNVSQLIALGRYSQDSLRTLVARTGIDYHRLERGILHFFSSERDFDAGAAAALVMRRHGVDRQVLSRDEVLTVEPALAAFAPRLAGGTFTPSDESGDARVFTQQLAALCPRVAPSSCSGMTSATCRSRTTPSSRSLRVREQLRRAGAKLLRADGYVAAMGSHTAPLLRPLGICA
jgi:D-amino-acid dehydrogenase